MKKLWVCDFCGRFEHKKSVMEQHEKECTMNPVNKYCYSCKYFEDTFLFTGCHKEKDYHKYIECGNCPYYKKS